MMLEICWVESQQFLRFNTLVLPNAGPSSVGSMLDRFTPDKSKHKRRIRHSAEYSGLEMRIKREWLLEEEK